MRRWGKWALCLLLAAILATAGTACGQEKEARQALDAMMQAFQTGQEEQIGAYYDFDQVSSFISKEDEAELRAAILDTLKQMTYQVESSDKKSGTEVTFQLKITTLDFSEVMDRYIGKVIELVGSPEYQANVSAMSQEAYQKQLADQMTAVLREGDDIPKADKEVSVTMVKEGDVWKAGGDQQAFLNALFANLSQAVDSLV